MHVDSEPMTLEVERKGYTVNPVKQNPCWAYFLNHQTALQEPPPRSGTFSFDLSKLSNVIKYVNKYSNVMKMQ